MPQLVWARTTTTNLKTDQVRCCQEVLGLRGRTLTKDTVPVDVDAVLFWKRLRFL